MALATSSKIRSYFRSSSFQMALLFTTLLGLSVGILGYFGYYFAQNGQGLPNQEVMLWLTGLGIVFMLLVILTSFAISTFVVGRTGHIAATAKSIMDTGDLSQRISIDSRWDDLGYMAEILNQLLARIEELMHGVKNVSDNIAHDLRTPLTRLRNNLETLQKNAGPQTADLCENMVAEADRLLATFAALLRIARIETGRQRNQFVPLQMDAVIRDVLEMYEPVADEKNIRITAQLEPASYHGDRDLLFQAFVNVLDNAIKFTPDGGTILITLDNKTFSIADSGPGVAAADRDKIFERFYRTEASRNTPGNGLGLALVAAVVKLHGASIALADANPGLRISIAF